MACTVHVLGTCFAGETQAMGIHSIYMYNTVCIHVQCKYMYRCMYNTPLYTCMSNAKLLWQLNWLCKPTNQYQIRTGLDILSLIQFPGMVSPAPVKSQLAMNHDLSGQGGRSGGVGVGAMTSSIPGLMGSVLQTCHLLQPTLFHPTYSKKGPFCSISRIPSGVEPLQAAKWNC